MPPDKQNLCLNLRTLQLGGPQGWIDITDPECELLRAFACSDNHRVGTTQLLQQAGKNLDKPGKHALEVQIVRLRKKLQQAGATDPTIKVIRGMGYQLCVPLVVLPTPASDPA